MKEQQLKKLLESYLHGELTAEEYREQALFHSFDSDFILFHINTTKEILLADGLVKKSTIMPHAEDDFRDFLYAKYEQRYSSNIITRTLISVTSFYCGLLGLRSHTKETAKMKNILPKMLLMYLDMIAGKNTRNVGFKSLLFLREVLSEYYPKTIKETPITASHYRIYPAQRKVIEDLNNSIIL